MTPPPLHPLHGPNPFKLGIFSANCDGGLTISKAPERWQARWDDIVALTLMAERAGFEFILPVARWKGFQGDANNLGTSFETLTHGAALASITSRIALFCTVHVPLVHPVFATKALVTIDHASHGRVGLNIVCGWNEVEFAMFGHVKGDQDQRYDQGWEWYQILTRLLEGGPEFDFKGRFYDLKGLTTSPVALQRPRPVTMSAGFSPKGRDFAARAADFLFTNLSDFDQAAGLVKSVDDHAARHGRKLGVFTMCHVVCRETRREAEEFYHYFAEEMADHASLAFYKLQKGVASRADPRYVERPLDNRFSRAKGHLYAGSYPGVFPLVGTPEDVAGDLIRIHRLGLAGTTVSFLDYLKELPFFVERVLPLLERAGLRRPAPPAAR